MAHGSGGFETWERPAHDGALHCVLCATTDPHAHHEWCAIAENLLCDHCCAALLHGDLMRMVSMAAHAARVVTPDTLIDTCSQCMRARRHAEQHLLEDAGDGDAPAC